MSVSNRALRGVGALLVAVVAAMAVVACGGSSSGGGSATSLLKQTFGGSHTVNSGNLDISVTVDPSGSSTLKGPITISFGGPFASLGKGKLPKSDFNVSISALGKSGSIGILSTGTNGYVTLGSTSYQLPASTFQQLESSFSSLTSSSGGGSGSGTLTKLGINPLNWLIHPTIAGSSQQVAGASTTHIRAEVNLQALLSDLNTFLGKASSLGISGSSKLPSSISAATQSKIAGEIQKPSVDVWTGSSDKTLRKLTVSLSVPVTGELTSLLGGLSAAQISLSMQYGDLNQPQTISAPTSVAPFTQFQAKLDSLISALQSSVAGAESGSTSGSTGSATTPSSGTSTAPSNTTSAYGQCIEKANGNITAMQKCAPLLNGQ